MFAEGNNEYPVIGPPTGPIAELGSFKEDALSAAVLGTNQSLAVKVFDRAGVAIVRIRHCLLFLALAALCSCAYKPLAVPASVTADAGYLFKLGLMRGHLLVGHALYAIGERDAARSHSKHPSDELYAGVAAEFATQGATPFAAELTAHADAVASGTADDVDAAYATLVAAIAVAEEAVADVSASLKARVIVLLLREAAREYGIGIVDGQLENAHEYQDAYGFTQVALRLARAEHARLQGADRETFHRIAMDIQALSDMWPTLVPPPRVPQHAARLDTAATDVEQMALRLRLPSLLR